eukprot:998465_1
MSSSESRISEYEVLDQIGGGSFGNVCKIRRKRDQKTFVWKVMDYRSMSDKEKKLMVSEVNILRQLDHAHIVRYENRILDRTGKKVYIIMELCGGGDLARLIKKRKKLMDYVDENFVWDILAGTVSALAECHQASRSSGKILHRDLKPGNIFLTEDLKVKLGDFGLSRRLSRSTAFARTRVGTPYYMSPEQVAREEYDERSDIWSLGCIIYELCALTVPFDASNELSLALKIRAGKYAPIPRKAGYSEELRAVVDSMLRCKPAERPTVSDLLKLRSISLTLREEQLSLDLDKLERDKREYASKFSKLESQRTSLASKESALSAQSRALEIQARSLDERERLLQEQQKCESFEESGNSKQKYYEDGSPSFIRKCSTTQKFSNVSNATMGSSELHSSARMATSSSNTANTSLFSSSTRSNSSVAKSTRNQTPTRPVRAFSNTCVNISLTSVSSSNSDRSLRWSPVPKRICVNSAAKRKLYRTPQPTNTSVSRTVGARTSPRHVFSARKTRPCLRSSGESSDGVTIRLSSCKKTKFNKKSPSNSIKSPQLVSKPSWNSKTS